jgi:hypothetical protein
VTDLALIIIATAAATVAVCLVVFHAYSVSRRRQLVRVREQRDAARAENRELRADRPAVHRTLARHAAQAVALTEPIPYQLADPTQCMPVFDGDNPAVAEYAELARAARHIRQGVR